MHRFLKLCRNFMADERGAFLALFGILALVLVAVSGAVVDYTSVQQARTRAQVALDAAALALQPRIYETGYDISGKAQALLINRVADSRIDAAITNVATDTTNGELTLTARMTVPLYFVGLIGIHEMSVELKSKSARKKLNLEVMMVLDNSNSMSSSSRMTNLIAAAKCAENILFNGDCASLATVASNDNVWIGIVPFTMQVNVGTGNASPSWMDRTGTVGSRTARGGTMSANITNDNFDDDDNDATTFNGPVDRIALFNQISNVSWGGCVEARKAPYDTTDAVPVAGTDTMFTPLFAPDEPDSGFSNSYLGDKPSSCNYSGTCTLVETATNCDAAATCSGSPTYSSMLTGSKTGSLACSCPLSGTYSQTLTGSGSLRTRTRTYSCSYSYPPQGLSSRELQERMCKYNGSAAAGVSQASAKGPNADCPTNAITSLTSTKSTVTTAINALSPQGGTNIHAGVIWGFRALSPTEPFTQGKPYDSTNAKVMIVMTDGENTAYQTGNMNNTTYYSFYGFPWEQRMGTSGSTNTQLKTEMDARTVASCASAKAAGITVYAVGLATASTSNQTKVETMLKNCSSGGGYYFFPANSTELTNVFKTIADQLGVLRLAQ